jgi:predicted permease
MTRYAKQYADTHGAGSHVFDPKTHPIVVAGFQEEIVRSVRRAMLVLLGAVGFVLLIACVNVANLLLARAEARRREIAVRAAIGAGLGRLLQQFIIEGVLLSLTGAVFGILLAFGGLRLLVATNSGSIPRVAEIGIDWQVLLFTLAISVATGVAFGLAPVIHMRTATLHDTLKATVGRATGAVAANRFRALLVTSELALALVLLIGSGLMVKAFWKLQEVDAGMNPNHLLTMRLSLPSVTYRDPASVNAFYSGLAARLNTLPGVVSAAIASGLPPSRPINANDTMIEGFVPVPNGPIQNIDYWNSVSGKYFETIGAHLLEGRFLNEADGAGAPLAVVVNQTMAKTYWPRESAVGHRVRYSGPNNPPWRTIVGVVADVKNAALDRPAGTELYFPFPQAPRTLSWVVVRAQGDPMNLTGAVRDAIRSLDRGLPISNIGTMEDVMSTARSRPRFLTLLLTLFSSLSLILAALGIYGVISYAVAQRTNEIGIRMALGARAVNVQQMVIRQGTKLAFVGVLIGVAGALALTQLMNAFLFEVRAADPLIYLAISAMLVAVAVSACWIPARRAARVDPMQALHSA